MRCAVLLDRSHLRIQREPICCLHIGRDTHITHGTPHDPMVAKSWAFHNPVVDGARGEYMRVPCGALAVRWPYVAPWDRCVRCWLGCENCCRSNENWLWTCDAKSGHDDNVPNSVSFQCVLSQLCALRDATRQLALHLDAALDAPPRDVPHRTPGPKSAVHSQPGSVPGPRHKTLAGGR